MELNKKSSIVGIFTKDGAWRHIHAHFYPEIIGAGYFAVFIRPPQLSKKTALLRNASFRRDIKKYDSPHIAILPYCHATI